jgi:cytochrome c-type biogenesis protein CcmH
MTLQFTIAALLLLVIFCAVIIIHFVRSKPNQIMNQERRNQLNHELYDIRLQEVEQDVEQGVVLDKETMIAELQYNLLDDIDEVKDKQIKVKEVEQGSQKIWVPGVLFLIVSSIALYWTVGAYKEVNDWQGALKRYPDIHQKLFEDNNTQPTEQELEDLMLGLRTHLANQPNDAQGWVLYSRLGRIFKDKDLAMGAIEKAVQASPTDVEIELEYIELKMKIGDEYEQATAEIMLKRLLQAHPDNYDAWSMFGFMALQQQDFTGAIERWQKMLILVTPNSDKAKTLNNSIAYAKQQLTLKGNAELDNLSVKATNNKPNVPVVEGVSYEVNVNVSAQVDYTENSTLFVYAQAVNGPPMPIAAIKLPITEFPVNVVLSDANVMMQGLKLSDHKQFIIKARISANGSVNKDAGEWFGQSEVIKAGEGQVINIQINQKS